METDVTIERQRIARTLSELHPKTSGDNGSPVCATCANLGEPDAWPCATLLVAVAPPITADTVLNRRLTESHGLTRRQFDSILVVQALRAERNCLLLPVIERVNRLLLRLGLQAYRKGQR